MKTSRPKTAWLCWRDGYVDFFTEMPIRPLTGAQAFESMLPYCFLELFGWRPGRRPVEVRLDRVHRQKAKGKQGRWKADRKRSTKR